MNNLNKDIQNIIVNGIRVGTIEIWKNTQDKFSAKILLIFAIGEAKKVSPAGIKIPTFHANEKIFNDLSKVELNNKIDEFLHKNFEDFQIIKD